MNRCMDKYVRPLDGFRGVSILLVLLAHLRIGYFGAGLGVDLFFVLSGFLITNILLKDIQANQTIDFKRFYWRRALRLLPALICMLVLAGILWPVTSPEAPSFTRSALAALFYFTNFETFFRSTVSIGSVAHTWSLSIEEQFYIVWPFLLLGLTRLVRGAREQARLVLILIVVLAVTRAFLYAAPSRLGYYFSTLARADSLLVGCAVALLLGHSKSVLEFWGTRRGAVVSWSCAAGLFLLTFHVRVYLPSMYYGLLTLIAVCGATLILHVVAAPNQFMARALSSGLLVQLGKRSYGFYLYHLPVFQYFDLWIDEGVSFILATILKLAVTTGIACASYRYIEVPCLNLRNRSCQTVTPAVTA